MRPLYLKALLIGSVVSQLVGYACWTIFSIDGAWYLFNAITHVGLWSAIAGLAIYPNYHIRKDKWVGYFVTYGVVLSFNQLVDEMFGLFAKTQWNEIVILCIIAIHLIYKLYNESTRP